MRVHVEAQPAAALSREQARDAMQGYLAWGEAHRGRVESFSFGAWGGRGVLTVADAATLMRMLAEWPFTHYRIRLTPLAPNGPRGA